MKHMNARLIRVVLFWNVLKKVVMVLQLVTGVHFKKWCVMQSKIRAGAINEVCTMFSCRFSCAHCLKN